MSPFAVLDRKKSYSKRGQESLRKQRRLEGELYNLTAWIRVAGESVKKLTTQKSQVKAHMVETGAVLPSHYGEICRSLEDEERRLAAFKEGDAELRSKIRALEDPSGAQRAQRLNHQRALCAGAAQRLEVDREMGAIIEQLRASLEQRAELSAKMRKHATALEFNPAADLLDEQRFDALLALLPDDLAEKSADWCARFAGQRPKGTIRCTVIKAFESDETVAHCGFYNPGEQVYLAPGHAAELAASGDVKLPEEYAPVRACQGGDNGK